MNKKEALKRLELLENETKELRKHIDLKGKREAKEWLLNYLYMEPFTVKVTEGLTTYYRNGQWVFKVDSISRQLWCYYKEVWKIFEEEYSMTFSQIQALQKEVTGKALGCEHFTPADEVHNEKT